MNSRRLPRQTKIAAAVSLALLSLSVSAQTIQLAADTTQDDLAKIVIKGAYAGDKEAKGSASAVAPTQSSLKATQPQSIITRDFVELAVAPTAEYSRVVNIAPSLSGDSANGPGLSETKTSMRGFSDDQYNITFDGIPWGDTNNPAHHSTSFFPASVIGGAVVERGPGNASNFGYATFGGSINLYSKKPALERNASVFGSFGTWNTKLLGAAYESGSMKDFGNATLQLNYQEIKSDGYLMLNNIKSDNYMLKFARPVGQDSLLTVFLSANKIFYQQNDNSKGPTLSQVAAFGKNFSLNMDPTSFNYIGYNYTHKDTDFSYARLETDWSNGWASDNSLYTYAYNNQTISSTDPTGKTAPGTVAGPKGNKNIPGIDKQNKYRTWGDIFKLSKEMEIGTFRTGFWYETSDTDRHQYDLDLSLGSKVRDPRETKPTPVTYADILFDQQSTIKNFQPFVEFEWKMADGLSVTPGVKSVNITRSVDALVNQTTRIPQHASVDFNTTLPFLTVNKQLGKELAVYAQYAKGFQIPDLKSFYITDPTRNSSDPQKSTNYQVGIVGKSPRMTWDLDLYRIDFTNKYVSNGLGGAAAAFVNIGGTTYKGFEGQATFVVGGGFSIYANGSINKATANDTGKTISGAPDMTAAAGALYESGPWAASLMYKLTGEVRQQDYTAANPTAYDTYKTAAYSNVDLGIAYSIHNPGAGFKRLKLQFNVFNLGDSQKVMSISPGSPAIYDQYLYQPPRSYQFSAKADF